MPGSHASARVATATAALLVASLTALMFLVWRDHHTGNVYYSFLPWNLFLAWIPFVLALAIRHGHLRRVPAPLLVATGMLWLLFLPNAPYLTTDLIHLAHGPHDHLVLDAATLIGFAAVGTTLGLVSLALVHLVVRARWGVVAGWLMSLTSIVLCSVGIYLGRVLRFNSWDAWHEPRRLIGVIGYRLDDPFGNPLLIVAVTACATALLAAYVVVWVAATNGLSDGRESRL